MATRDGYKAKTISRTELAYFYCLGATKRILFVPDMQNIHKIENILSKLQIFLDNNMFAKFWHSSKPSFSVHACEHDISIHDEHDYNITIKRTLRFICENLSRDSSLAALQRLDHNNHERQKYNSLYGIQSLYDNDERDYLKNLIDNDRLSSNTNVSHDYNYNCNSNKYNKTVLDLHRSVQKIKRAMQDDRKNCNKVLSEYGIDINIDWEKIENISQINLTPNDIKINYKTWRANVDSKIFYNHYYHHTLKSWPERLDYDIELYRKCLNYPKLYNIDYDFVEKIYKYDCCGWLKLLDGSTDLESIYQARERTQKSAFKCCYDNLREFYHDYNVVWSRTDLQKSGVIRHDKYIKDYDLYDENEHKNYWPHQQRLSVIGNVDRMYVLQLNPMIKKWYKNGKYLLYRILPYGHDNSQETGLTIDFCHFEIYYNRLKLLQSVYSDDKEKKTNTNTSKLEHISQYTWIALNDCSRYCKDELYRQDLFSSTYNISRTSFVCQQLFVNDDKATWDRRNKHRYQTRVLNDKLQR